jgi:hypothetical protein
VIFIIFHLTTNLKSQTTGTTAIGQTYHNVLKVGPFDTPPPSYFYIDTKIPFNDVPAPQIHITGYNYAHSNKAIKLTLSWYVYNNAFYWSQYKNDIGYYNPSRIRLGTYNDGGTQRVRIEIANDGTYWSSYFFSATDHNGTLSYYDGWRYYVGLMPGETGNINTVAEHSGIIFTRNNNVLIGKASQSNAAYKLDISGIIRADEIVVNTTGADFVFEPHYKLLSIPELEAFIKANKRLPDISPAKEMQENGVSSGEMQAKLLQKVEELTLYIIELEKRIKELESKN